MWVSATDIKKPWQLAMAYGINIFILALWAFGVSF